MATAMQMKSDLTVHRISVEAKSQVTTDRSCELYQGETDVSTFSPEVEARRASGHHFTATEGHFCTHIRNPPVFIIVVEGKGWFKGRI